MSTEEKVIGLELKKVRYNVKKKDTIEMIEIVNPTDGFDCKAIKEELRHYARNMEKVGLNYFTPIRLVDDSDLDNDYPIDNLGKYVFGATNFKPHILIRVYNSKVYVVYPNKLDQHVKLYINKLVNQVNDGSLKGE